jgi:hypothetical protein
MKRDQIIIHEKRTIDEIREEITVINMIISEIQEIIQARKAENQNNPEVEDPVRMI